MADADTLLRQGDLDGARKALVAVVQAQPADEPARMFLFQLLGVLGEWDKAKKQLDALAQLSPAAQMLAVAYGQAIEAERVRAAVFAGKRPMPLLAGAGGWAEGLAEAITAFACGDVGEGDRLRDIAFDAAPDTPGSFTGERFDWLGDADSRFGPAIEIVVGGRYGLIALDQIAAINSEGPKALRDTVWYPVEVTFRDGHSAAAFLPARYPGSEAAAGDERLGRATSWVDREWGQEGSGQHLWALSDGTYRGMFELRRVKFD